MPDCSIAPGPAGYSSTITMTSAARRDGRFYTGGLGAATASTTGCAARRWDGGVFSAAWRRRHPPLGCHALRSRVASCGPLRPAETRPYVHHLDSTNGPMDWRNPGSAPPRLHRRARVSPAAAGPLPPAPARADTVCARAESQHRPRRRPLDDDGRVPLRRAPARAPPHGAGRVLLWPHCRFRLPGNETVRFSIRPPAGAA